MNQRKCKICGAAFTPKQFNQVICSFQCKKENSRRRSFAYSVFSREIVKWKPKEIECGFCHKRFLPTNSSQGLHTECRILKKQFYTVLNYFQICTKYRLIFMTNMLEHKSQTTTQGRDHLDLFYSYKNWCDICKNKINENRRANKPSKTEKFIYECLKKHFPDDNIVLLDRRQIRYKGWWWEIDVYNRSKKFGFEYDDPKHFSSTGLQRNIIKQELCKKQGIKLLRINYKEPLTEDLVLLKLKQNHIC